MTEVENAGPIQSILVRHDRSRDSLIPLLQEVQGGLGYLSQQAVAAVARYLGVSENDVFGVATFYSQFRFNPPGRHCVKICQGTACHVRGSGLLVEAIGRNLHIVPGQTTADGKVSLESVMCLGSCALAPAVVVDDTVYGRMTQKKLEKVLEGIE